MQKLNTHPQPGETHKLNDNLGSNPEVNQTDGMLIARGGVTMKLLRVQDDRMYWKITGCPQEWDYETRQTYLGSASEWDMPLRYAQLRIWEY